MLSALAKFAIVKLTQNISNTIESKFGNSTLEFNMMHVTKNIHTGSAPTNIKC